MRDVKLTLPVAAALLLAPIHAQCFQPSFGQPAATPSQLTGDVVLPIQPIGFAFPLGGTTYSDLHICDKGYVYLSNAGIPAPGGADYTATAAELASGPPRIAPLWSDLVVLGSAGGMIHVDSTPQRCLVTWENVQCFGGNCAPFSMQLQLLPSGEVSFVYSQGAINNSSPSSPTWQVGVAGVSPGGVTLGSLTDLSSSGATVDDLIVEEWPGSAFDMAGRGLLLAPSSPGWVFVPPQGCADLRRYGEGCVAGFGSVHEGFSGSFDLDNTTLCWLRSGSGYVVTNSVPGTYVQPSATATQIAPGQLDGEQLVTLSQPMPVAGGVTSSWNVTTKGTLEVAAAPTGNIDWSPSAAELLQWPNTVFACWHDYDQSAVGSGQIWFEEIAGVAYVTWDGVHAYGGTTPSTFQFQLDLATGHVTLVMLGMGGVASGATVVGYSAMGAAQDPGATDLSATGVMIEVGDVDVLPLALDANGLPQLGSAGFAFEIANVPNLVPLAFLFVGDTAIEPGLDLGFLGMPGCAAYTNGNLTSATISATLPQGVATQPLPIPNAPALVGSQLTCQAMAFSLDTPLNLVSSNGLAMTIGN